MAIEIYKEADVVVDTSAMLKEINLLEHLERTFHRVYVPQVCVDELSGIKDRSRRTGGNSKAWQVLARLKKKRNMIYNGRHAEGRNDDKIIDAARSIADVAGRDVYIVTDDIDFSCRYDKSLVVGDLVTKIVWAQNALGGDPQATKDFCEVFLDDWSGYELPDGVNVNGILPGGETVLITTIRSRNPKKYAKIQYLIDNGVDLDQNDSAKNFLPPLAHCAQINDLEAFKLLVKAGADINKGSRNESKNDYIKCRNESNTPLMVACFHGRREIVKYLVSRRGLCYNQQDSNGYTALAKCALNGFRDLYDLLLPKTDGLIRDRNNHTAQWHLRQSEGNV